MNSRDYMALGIALAEAGVDQLTARDVAERLSKMRPYTSRTNLPTVDVAIAHNNPRVSRRELKLPASLPGREPTRSGP